jgi:hypothetical protein
MKCNRVDCEETKCIHIIRNNYYCRNCVDEFRNAFSNDRITRTRRQLFSEFEKFKDRPKYNERIDGFCTVDTFIEEASTSLIREKVVSLWTR